MFNTLRSDLRWLCGRLETRLPDWQALLSAGPTCRLVTFCNPFSLRQLADDPHYRRNLDEFDLTFADGILLSKFTAYATGIATPRVAFDGNSIALDVLAYANALGLSIGLVGGEPGEVDVARTRLAEQGIDIAYTHHGYLSAAERQRVQCAAKQLDVVLVGLGSPLQEAFLVELKQSGWTGVGFTCGAYISQTAARGVRYYPDWMNRLHLRMFFRLINEPRKLVKRYSWGYLPFYLGSLWMLLGGGE